MAARRRTSPKDKSPTKEKKHPGTVFVMSDVGRRTHRQLEPVVKAVRAARQEGQNPTVLVDGAIVSSPFEAKALKGKHPLRRKLEAKVAAGTATAQERSLLRDLHAGRYLTHVYSKTNPKGYAKLVAENRRSVAAKARKLANASGKQDVLVLRGNAERDQRRDFGIDAGKFKHVKLIGELSARVMGNVALVTIPFGIKPTPLTLNRLARQVRQLKRDGKKVILVTHVNPFLSPHGKSKWAYRTALRGKPSKIGKEELNEITNFRAIAGAILPDTVLYGHVHQKPDFRSFTWKKWRIEKGKRVVAEVPTFFMFEDALVKINTRTGKVSIQKVGK